MCASADGGLGDGTIPAHRSAGYGSSVAPRHAPGLCSDFGKTLPPRWYRSKLTPACGEGRSRCFCATSRALSKLVSRCKNPPFCAGPALFGNPLPRGDGCRANANFGKEPFHADENQMWLFREWSAGKGGGGRCPRSHSLDSAAAHHRAGCTAATSPGRSMHSNFGRATKFLEFRLRRPALGICSQTFSRIFASPGERALPSQAG
jgi:hypothetical protein